MQSENPSRIEVSYSDSIENTNGTYGDNIIKATPEFMEFLQKEEMIVIQGEADDQFIFSSGPLNFKLRGIFLPTTMLVTPSIASKDHSDNFNQEHFSTPVARVTLQTTKYLKIQSHQVQFHTIYQQLSVLALDQTIFTQNLTLKQILDQEGVSMSNLKIKYKLTPSLIEKLASVGPFTFFRSEFTEDTLLLQFSPILMNAMLKQLLPFLTSKGLLGQWFTFNTVQESVPFVSIKFLDVLARSYAFQTDPPLPPPSANCSQMEIQRKYRVTLVSVLTFIMTQIFLSKKQFSKGDLQDALKSLMAIYLPIGDDEFSQQKAHEQLSIVLPRFFLTINQKDKINYIYYDPLALNSSIKARVQQIGTFKKKFSRSEIDGIFLTWYTPQEIEQMLIKNFRRMGKEYEIKLIIPK